MLLVESAVPSSIMVVEARRCTLDKSNEAMIVDRSICHVHKYTKDHPQCPPPLTTNLRIFFKTACPICVECLKLLNKH